MSQRKGGSLQKVLDWLNHEDQPGFSLDPGYTEPTDMTGAAAGPAPVRAPVRKRPPRRPIPGWRKQRGTGAKEESHLTGDIEEDVRRIRDTLHLPENSDVVVREIEIPLRKPRRAAVLFVGTMIDKRLLNSDLLDPLLAPPVDRKPRMEQSLAKGRLEPLFPRASVTLEGSLPVIFWEVSSGKVAIIVDGFRVAALADAAGWRHRDVAQPLNERVVRGPHQAFVEPLKVNVTMVRRIIRSPNLMVETARIGNLTQTEVVVMYVDGIANPRLVAEVKRRLGAISLDYVATDGELEQLLDERTSSIIPSTMITERPDRLSAHLAEGYVGVLTDNAPAAIIIPSTAAALVENPEDFYMRWPYGTFLRLLRFFGLLVAMFAPAVFVAAMEYHQEMVPTNLLFAIGATREAVPLPAAFIILMTLVAFDLIQEAGVRVPAPIGPTIGIVGALLIGEAAVRASLITPAAVILVSITAVASYTISSPQLATMVRVSKYLYLVAAAVWGLVAVGLLWFAELVYLCSIRNFGVPFMVPFAPRTKGNPDVAIRGPLWEMERRPAYLRPLEQHMAPPITRRWTKGRDNPNDDPGR